MDNLQSASLKGNIYGGITAAVVALPLALAFGISSGAGAAAGLYGAIFVGLFASLFGGTPSQISGPTGPMTVVMAVILTQFIAKSPEHGVALAFTAVLLGGFFQMLFGIFKVGKYIVLVPYPVISGFMSGIGLIILILQLGPLLGAESGANVVTVLQNLPEMIASANIDAIILASLTLAIIYLWPSKLSKIIPSALAALIVGTLVYILFLPDANLSHIGAIDLGLPSISWPYFDAEVIVDVIEYALMLAALGSIDSLLTSLVADNMTGTKHNSDKELIGQGIGNMIAGLFGALPGAGATMRTAININTGGTSKLSGIIHALILLLIALGAGVLVEQVPYAVLAGILVSVGIGIIDWPFIKRLHRLPRLAQLLMLGVMFLTVFYDLMTAVILGVFIKNIITIDRLTRLQLDGLFITDGTHNTDKLPNEEKSALLACEGKTLLFHIDGPMSYGVAHEMQHSLEGYNQHQTLIIDFSNATIVGVTTGLVIEDIILSEHSEQRTVYLTGLNDSLKLSLGKLDIFKIVDDQHQFEQPLEAILKSQN